MSDFGYESSRNGAYGFYIDFAGCEFEFRHDQGGRWDVVFTMSAPGSVDFTPVGLGGVQMGGPSVSVNLTDPNGSVRHGTGTGYAVVAGAFSFGGNVAREEIGHPDSFRLSLTKLFGDDGIAAPGSRRNSAPAIISQGHGPHQASFGGSSHADGKRPGRVEEVDGAGAMRGGRPVVVFPMREQGVNRPVNGRMDGAGVSGGESAGCSLPKALRGANGRVKRAASDPGFVLDDDVRAIFSGMM